MIAEDMLTWCLQSMPDESKSESCKSDSRDKKLQLLCNSSSSQWVRKEICLEWHNTVLWLWWTLRIALKRHLKWLWHVNANDLHSRGANGHQCAREPLQLVLQLNGWCNVHQSYRATGVLLESIDLAIIDEETPCKQLKACNWTWCLMHSHIPSCMGMLECIDMHWIELIADSC